MRLWRALLASHSWQVVFDVGVNYGEMLLGVELARVEHVVGFEPNPRVLPHLLRSLEEAGVAVPIRRMAVSARAGETVTFAIDMEWSGMSGIAASRSDGAGHRVEEIEVESTSIDAELAALDAPGAVLVKVDVEGAEASVLAGAEGLLTSDRRWVMLVEVLHMSLDEQVSLLERFDVIALDMGVGDLVRVPTSDLEEWRRAIESGWIYPQDLAIASAGVADGLPSIADRIAMREQLLAATGRDAASVTARDAALAHAEARAAAAEGERDAARAERDAVLASTSWRVTGPLRRIVDRVRRR